MMSEENNNSTSDIRLLPIAKLLDGSYHFFVPDYQRGYRWTAQQVEELLKDLLTFAIYEQGNNSYYCLQPIVVRRNGDRWEVIDGQQRLTTIKILLHYLKEFKGKVSWAALRIAPYSIKYATRPNSNEYIDNLNGEEDFCETPSKQKTDIDLFHIRQAYKTIKTWFETQEENGAQALCSRLGAGLDNAWDLVQDLLVREPTIQGQNPCPTVQVIWFQTSSGESGIRIFNRLNTGKLELTDAELVKGLFMLPANAGSEEEQYKKAFRWEQMENAFHSDSFWHFLVARNDPEPPNRIDLLLRLVNRDLFADEEMGNGEANRTATGLARFRPIFNRYNDRFNIADKESRQTTIENEWEKLEKAFRILEDWYSDPEIYNLIGYLRKTATAKLEDLFSDFEQLAEEPAKTRKDFVNKLIERIRGSYEGLEITFKENESSHVEGIGRKDYTIHLYYGDERVFNLLLLLNVEHLNRRARAKDLMPGENDLCKFPFAVLSKSNGWDATASNGWDIEHVDSRTSNPLTSDADIKEWVDTCRLDLLPILNDDQRKQIEDIDQSALSEKEKNQKLLQLMRYFAGETDDDDPQKDNISNLVLLDSQTNRSYKNSLFVKKRRVIITRRENGQFVPETTAYVFFKLLERDATKYWEWKAENRQMYVNYIVNQLAPDTAQSDKDKCNRFLPDPKPSSGNDEQEAVQ